MANDFNYEIVEKIGILSQSENGWTKEINLISYNNAKPKYDIRDWAPEHERMGKGITLNDNELDELKTILNNM